MVYPDNINGLLQEIRDTLNTDNDPISQYPDNKLGLLQNIRDLLGGDGVGYSVNLNGLLEEIRDLLNTEDASVAAYPNGQYGLWQAIRDFANTEDASVASYPDGIPGLIQATRDFLISSGSGYVANWVRFDGASWLSNPALVCVNSSKFTIAFGFVVDDAAGFPTYFASDPENAEKNYLQAGDVVNSYFFRFATSTSAPNISPDSPYPSLGDYGVQHSFLLSVDTTKDAPRVCVYVDGVKFSGPYLDSIIGVDTTLAFNGLSFWIGADGFDGNLTGQLSDFQVWTGLSLLDGGVDIPLADRRNFLDADGDLVDPATATAAYGSQTVLFSGDAASWATQADDQDFAIHGSLTDVP